MADDTAPAAEDGGIPLKVGTGGEPVADTPLGFDVEAGQAGRYVELPVAALVGHPRNRRQLRDDEAMAELVESVRQDGVVEPILVRPLPDEASRYQIVAGHRRHRAAALAGLERVGCVLRPYEDHQALRVMAIENMHRSDLRPLEEALTVQDLLDDGESLETVAQQIGRSTRWVARRASLTHLAESWVEAVNDPACVISRWPVGHLEAVARLPQETQQRLLRQFSGRFGEASLQQVVAQTSLAQLKALIRRQLKVLHLAPWSVGDAELVPEQGACATCQRRSDRHPELWDANELDAGEGDADERERCVQCLDPGCWSQKEAAYRTALLERVSRETGCAAQLMSAQPWYQLRNFTVEAEPGEEGARPYVHDEGPDLGRVEWRKPVEQDTAEAGPSSEGAWAPPDPADPREVAVCEAVARWLCEVADDEDSARAPEKGISYLDALAMTVTFGAEPVGGEVDDPLVFLRLWRSGPDRRVVGRFFAKEAAEALGGFWPKRGAAESAEAAALAFEVADIYGWRREDVEAAADAVLAEEDA